jgi:hypothetical protein
MICLQLRHTLKQSLNGLDLSSAQLASNNLFAVASVIEGGWCTLHKQAHESAWQKRSDVSVVVLDSIHV